ncbi:MAG: response regulator [Candidatus Kapaibacterium sp.]|nr:MAG: response regulator [Candidatus Kapabacteria bacterium]
MPSSNTASNDELMLIDDSDEILQSRSQWHLLIVDDDEEIHSVTRYALADFRYQDAPLTILSAYSGSEAREILRQTPQIAVVIIDVVMESNDAGLRLVECIRNDLKNEFVRLVLRTGQPGQAPEHDVIAKYDINDYKNKAELTNTRLMTLMTTALRSFSDIKDLDDLRKNLEHQVHERTRELTYANERLHAVNIEKDELLGIVAHDLKNPLNVLLNMVAMYEDMFVSSMLDGSDMAQIREFLHLVESSAEKMLNLISKLLDVNALEQGKFRMNLISCPPAVLIAQTVEFMRHRAEVKNIALHCDISPEAATAHVFIDEQAFGQVVENLLSNAVKYSPHGKNVYVRMKSEGGNMKQESSDTSALSPQISSFLRLEVADEGPGISAEDMKKLFGKFARLTAQPTGGEDSTGLGLAIVKKMVEAMNGKVWCESELGKGATFIVELPIVA